MNQSFDGTNLHASQSASVHSAKTYNLVAIDDEPTVLRALNRSLNGEEFALQCFEDANQGLELLQGDQPVDAILLDYEMHETTGVEVLQKIRRIESRQQTPIIMLTGSGSDQIQSIAFERGVSDYVTKPIAFTALSARLRRHCHEYREKSQLEMMAFKDELTGLANRRFLNASFEREISRARRDGHYLSIIMLDIDHFKRINDTYGHGFGDFVLERVGSLIRSYFRRATDLAIRFGGEEILVLTSDSDYQQSQKRLIDCLDAIREMRIKVPDSQRVEQITLSAGAIAVDPNVDQRDKHALIATADQALYQAKRVRDALVWLD